MRSCRYLWILILGLIPALALAESIPATQTTSTIDRYHIGGQQAYAAHASATDACTAFGGTFQAPLNCITDIGKPWQSAYAIARSWVCPTDYSKPSCITYSCPAEYTLNGTMCDPKPPQCPPDKPTQLADGTCVDACAAFAGVEELQYISIDPNVYDGSCESVGSQLCGFVFSRAVPNSGHVVAGAAALPAYGIYKKGTGQSCSTAKNPNQPPTPPDLPEKKPPCDAAEGVLTSTSGRVMCVPSGTPSARKPEVEQKEKKETFPDGTEKLTQTTKTRDPKTGAESTHTTTTSGGGQSGEPGTSTSTEDAKKPDGVSGTGSSPGGSGDGDGDCEGENCGGDGGFKPPEGGELYEKGERTIKQAWQEFVTRITTAQLPASMTNFFNVSGAPSSCGGMSINVPMLDIMISLDEYLCGETAQFLMHIARIVIAAMAAWLAFRIAFQ